MVCCVSNVYVSVYIIIVFCVCSLLSCVMYVIFICVYVLCVCVWVYVGVLCLLCVGMCVCNLYSCVYICVVLWPAVVCCLCPPWLLSSLPPIITDAICHRVHSRRLVLGTQSWNYFITVTLISLLWPLFVV